MSARVPCDIDAKHPPAVFKSYAVGKAWPKHLCDRCAREKAAKYELSLTPLGKPPLRPWWRRP